MQQNQRFAEQKKLEEQDALLASSTSQETIILGEKDIYQKNLNGNVYIIKENGITLKCQNPNKFNQCTIWQKTNKTYTEIKQENIYYIKAKEKQQYDGNVAMFSLIGGLIIVIILLGMLLDKMNK
jgi:hypothetical protein